MSKPGTGSGGNLRTSRGRDAGIDLTPALVADDHGHRAAATVARQLVVYLQRSGGHAQFSTLMAGPSRRLSLLLRLVVLAAPLTLLLPSDPRPAPPWSSSPFSPGAGGLLDTRVRNGILVMSAVSTGVLDKNLAQSSLWLLGVVTSLELARDSEAPLAARERL